MSNFKSKIVRRLKNAEKNQHSGYNSVLAGVYRSYKRLKKMYRTSDNSAVARIAYQGRAIKNHVTGKRVQYVTFEKLVNDIREILPKIDSSIDLILGVPRSGLLAASILAVKLGKPLSAVGESAKWSSASMNPVINIKKILIVDDSVTTGESMKKAIEIVRKQYPDAHLISFAPYVTEEMKSEVNLYARIIPKPRYFEWNMAHAKKGNVAVDLDGVLCEEPEPHLEEDDQAYQEWIQSVPSYIIPAFTIDTIVTNRLEKHRAATETWLNKHGIMYNKLIMNPAKSRVERKEQKKGAHKVSIISKERPVIFWESGKSEAEIIWHQTRIPVYCVETNSIYS